MPTIITIVALVAAVVIGVSYVWYRSQPFGKSSALQVLDLFLLQLFFFFLIARILGIIYFSEQLPTTWALLPLTQPEEEIRLLAAWPWVFFRFYDGVFLFIEAGMAATLGHIAFRSMHALRVKHEQLQVIGGASFMLALLPMGVAMIINNYLPNDFNPAVSIAFLSLTTVIAIVSSLFITKRIAFYFMIFVSQTLGLLFVNVAAVEPQRLALVYLLQVGGIILTLLLILSELGKSSSAYEATQVRTRKPELS